MIAQLGLSNVWLKSGNLVKARREAGTFLESALSTADPYLHALAWELKSRIAIAELDWKQADDYIHNGLAILKEFDVPMAAWQIHATASDLYLQAKDEQAAETHRSLAKGHILTIANSFLPDEPLREIFLDAGPVRRTLAEKKQNWSTQSRKRKAAAPDGRP